MKTNLGLSVLENAQSLHVFKSNSIRVAFNSQETTDHLQACESERKFAKTAGSPGDWTLNRPSPIRQKFAKSVVWVTETGQQTGPDSATNLTCSRMRQGVPKTQIAFLRQTNSHTHKQPFVIYSPPTWIHVTF